VWELGVKEIWRVPKPLQSIVHTMGWPLRRAQSTASSAALSSTRWATTCSPFGMVVGLDYRDVELSAHDLLQELKTHPRIRNLLEGGANGSVGAQRRSRAAASTRCRSSSYHAPGLLLCGDGVGMVNIPRLKGIHYAIESGRLAAESAFASLRPGATPATSLASYDEAVKGSFIYSDLEEVRDMRQVFGRGFFIGGALASAMTVSKGRLDLGKLRAEPDAEQPLIRTGRAARYPAADGKLTFDKLSSVFLSGNKTRDDQPEPHPHRAHGASRRRRHVGAHVPRAGVRGRCCGGRRHRGRAGLSVELRPVRCDHREGRPPDAPRGRLRSRVHADLARRTPELLTPFYVRRTGA